LSPSAKSLASNPYPAVDQVPAPTKRPRNANLKLNSGDDELAATRYRVTVLDTLQFRRKLNADNWY
jgi:hypothetical protein